ncbi:hypothetical protein COBT_003474, partial [Conglomerata obtusa]
EVLHKDSHNQNESNKREFFNIVDIRYTTEYIYDKFFKNQNNNNLNKPIVAETDECLNLNID